MFRPHPFPYWLVAAACLCIFLVAAAAAEAAGPRAPRLASPADEATVSAVPAFTWSHVKKADRYEFQLSADANFGSIVGGRGTGSFTTKNLAGTLTKSIADGTYWWRVRAINAKGKAGKWSTRRSLTKAWGPAPQLLGPADSAAVLFPSEPLVLRWSAVPRAYRYRVFIATDPGLGSLAVGREPVETAGTVFSPGVSLPPGRYYWGVEPVDAAGHRGARSNVGSLVWSWPSATETGYTDLVADPRMAEPQLSWKPVPGAVAYHVEINHSEDFAVGSRVCCDAPDTGLTGGLVYGTAFSPKRTLPNNVYHWRVRGIDADGNAGQWNRGPVFDMFFGNGPETVGNLRLRDNFSDLAPGATTGAPVIAWDPVPGAAKYAVQITPVEGGACNWSTTSTSEYWSVDTPSTAFTFLAPIRNGVVPIETSGLSVSTDSSKRLVDGHSYCVRVQAKRGNDAIVSDWTQLGGIGATAFTYDAYVPATPPDGPMTASSSDYVVPLTGTLTPRVPLLTWKRIAGAHSYYVVVAKNAGFTTVVDVALVINPAYVPRTRTYADDNTPYYWAVLPAKQADGEEVTSQPSQNAPQSFDKRSVAPRLLTPADGETVDDQPVFRWTSGDPILETPEGARDYRLQVAQDPSFANPLDDVTTAATAYASTRSYPADTVLYWRVRVTDANGVGLTWSPTGAFRRRLPTPAILLDNAQGGSTIPALRWTPVQGAESYSVHVDQADGTRKDFTLRGTAFTPTFWYGTGVWRWQVRANFPSGSGVVSSAYTGAFPFTRRIPSPDGVRVVNRGGRMLISWEPSQSAGIKEYQVELSSSDSFETVGQTIRTQNLSVAPDITKAPFVDGGRVYWRIFAVDEGGNLGGAGAGRFVTARRMVLQVLGSLLRGQRSKLVATTLTAAGRKVRKVKVRVTGRPVKAVAKRTGKRGRAAFRIRARRRGTVLIRATRDGYRPAETRITVP